MGFLGLLLLTVLLTEDSARGMHTFGNNCKWKENEFKNVWIWIKEYDAVVSVDFTWMKVQTLTSPLTLKLIFL